MILREVPLGHFAIRIGKVGPLKVQVQARQGTATGTPCESWQYGNYNPESVIAGHGLVRYQLA